MPSCFSRPIRRLALYRNHNADDEKRQRLLPFVTLLACADMPEVESERAAYIDARTGPFMSFDDGFKVLEGALRIGRQADDVSHDEASSRMEAVRRVAKTPLWDEDTPIFAKLKKVAFFFVVKVRLIIEKTVAAGVCLSGRTIPYMPITTRVCSTSRRCSTPTFPVDGDLERDQRRQAMGFGSDEGGGFNEITKEYKKPPLNRELRKATPRKSDRRDRA